MAWDPTAQKPSTWVDIESSRDSEGVAQGAILCTPWNGGRRLAYENRMSDAIKYEVDERGARVRKVLAGNLRVLSLLLTVTDSRGFGPGANFASREWVDTLDPDVLEECIAAALKVQPLPTTTVAKPADRKESGPAPDDDDEDEGDGDSPDPSPKLSTPGA